MLDSKSTHLAERVADPLRQAGVLEQTAANQRGAGRRTASAVQPSRATDEHGPRADADGGSVAGLHCAGPADQAVCLADLDPRQHGLSGIEPTPDSGSIDSRALQRAGMIDWSHAPKRISEELRPIRRQILRNAFAAPGRGPGYSNLLMLTSARPGEGKSFIAINLAGSIVRQTDRHVLLVDANATRSSISVRMGLTDAPGLLGLAANPKLDPDRMLVRTAFERLSVLPVGRELGRSPTLFSSHEIARAVQSLGGRYAEWLLILDAPSCLCSRGPASLAPAVGQIVFVVEAERTQRDQIEASLDLIDGCPSVALVLNKRPLSSRHRLRADTPCHSS